MNETTTEDIVNRLTPLQRARVTDEFYDIVFGNVSIKTVRDNAGDDLRQRIESGVASRFAGGEKARDEIILQLLLAFAQDGALEPRLLEAVTIVTESETLGILSQVTAAMLINLTLLNATTTVKIDHDAHGQVVWSVVKTVVDPKLLEVATKLAGIFEGKK